MEKISTHINYKGIPLYESILDDEDEVMDNIGNSMIEEWMKQYIKGQYKTIKLKNGHYKIWGNIYIKDCPDETLPAGFTLAFLEGTLNIKNCGFKSLYGLFTGEIKTLNVNISISNCPNLVDLKGLPWWIKGDLNVSNCRSLKSLDGIPEFVEGEINLMKIGKKFKPDQIKKMTKLTRNIYCSLEEEEDIITEAVNEPHLYRLIKQIDTKAKELRKTSSSFKDLMRFKYNGLSWDQITSDYITIYKEINSKALTACRKILSGNDSGLIVTINYDREYNYMFNNEKQVFKINEYHCYSWENVTTTEAVDMIKGENEVMIIKIAWADTEDGALDGLNAYKKQSERSEARRGMIPTGLSDKEYKVYYKKLAQENQDRYKKILAKLKAERDKDIDKYSKQVGDLLDRFMKFNTQALAGKIKIKAYELSSLNKHFYGEKTFVGYRGGGGRGQNPYVGEDGLMTIFSEVGECFMQFKEGNNPDYHQKKLTEYKDKLRLKIEYCDRRLKEYNM